MARKQGITPKQIDALKRYSRKGYSANKIQRKLRSRHMGMRRTRLLGYVREFKRQKPKPSVAKYTPTKYAQARMRLPQFGGKYIAIYGTTRNRKGIVKRNRIELSGSGRELYEAVKRFHEGIIPKVPYTRKNVANLTDDDVEHGEWLNIEVESR